MAEQRADQPGGEDFAPQRLAPKDGLTEFVKALPKRVYPKSASCTVIAPHSVHWEVGSALSAMLRRERIKIGQAIRAVQIYQQIPIRFVDVELEETLKIAAALGIYAFVIRPEKKAGSPLDVEGLDLGITASEIVQFIQEGRRTVYESAAQADAAA